MATKKIKSFLLGLCVLIGFMVTFVNLLNIAGQNSCNVFISILLPVEGIAHAANVSTTNLQSEEIEPQLIDSQLNKLTILPQLTLGRQKEIIDQFLLVFLDTEVKLTPSDSFNNRKPF